MGFVSELPEQTNREDIAMPGLTCYQAATSDHRYAARRPSVRESLLIGLDAELGCSSGELKLGVDVELRVGVAQMCFDGAFAEEQVPGDVRR